jgi:acyl-CoA synthetase (AMP-forming)/AMP-acid ligase II
MLYEFIKYRMLEHPDQIVSDGSKTLTYSEVLERAEELGDQLTEEKYGLLCDSDFDTAISLLACFCARKTAIPLSKKYGEKHVSRIIEKVQIAHLLTSSGVVRISDSMQEPEDLTDVALIMCTSGTTGMPKGAMITEENLVANLNDIEKYFLINNTDHILIARPLYHCAVLTGELLISLIKGLQISFFSEGFIPQRIISVVKDQKATVLCGTPTLFYHLAALKSKSKNPLDLRVIVVSGECMTQKAAESIRRAFSNSKIYNVYGLTEASPRACYLPPEEFDINPLSVGIPLTSLKAKIEDNELLLKGGSIMRGYYNDPDATAKAIRNGWLYTGDIAERDENGRVYIKCRRDNMIIRSGMNIYPQEIENALKQDERIRDVLAYGEKNETVSEKIHIKVIAELSKSEVFEVCRKLLSSYQLPDVIDIVDEIPKNASGKVIRNAKGNRN